MYYLMTFHLYFDIYIIPEELGIFLLFSEEPQNNYYFHKYLQVNVGGLYHLANYYYQFDGLVYE